jgi:hypothetical protein
MRARCELWKVDEPIAISAGSHHRFPTAIGQMVDVRSGCAMCKKRFESDFPYQPTAHDRRHAKRAPME